MLLDETQDNYVTNVIVFDYTKLGVLLNGAASILSGVTEL